MRIEPASLPLTAEQEVADSQVSFDFSQVNGKKHDP